MLRRRRGMGLLVAAVVGGANADGNSAVRSSAGEFGKTQQLAYLQDQVAREQTAPSPPSSVPAAAPPYGSSMDAKIAQLQELGKLRAAGVLTVEEFAAQKAQILASSPHAPGEPP